MKYIIGTANSSANCGGKVSLLNRGDRTNMNAYKPQNDSMKSNDAKYIYNLCRQQIHKAITPEDLLPMIKLLIPMETLKDKLLETVGALHGSSTVLQEVGSPQDVSIRTKSNPNDIGGIHKLQRLYLNSSSISEIFSHSILMNIIRFIPPQQFGNVSRVSSHFREIMVGNPVLYNDYEMTIDESLKQSLTETITVLIDHLTRSIRFKAPMHDKYGTADYIFRPHTMNTRGTCSYFQHICIGNHGFESKSSEELMFEDRCNGGDDPFAKRICEELESSESSICFNVPIDRFYCVL